MSGTERHKLVRAGDWRTLESGWNATFMCIFQDPAGARIKVRYGSGWWFGRDGQEQTLDGRNDKSITVGRGSLAYARVQMKVPQDTEVHYVYAPIGP